MLQEMRILVVGLLAAVAANAETKAFPSTKHDVKTYGTYEWKNPPRIINAQGGDEKDSPFVQLVRDAVNRQLAAKGYREAPNGGDLQIISGAVAAKANQLEGFLVTLGFDAYWGYWFGMPYPVNSINRMGVLFVGMVDKTANEGVWAGYDTEALDRVGSMNVDAAKGKIDKAASKLFKKLPARAATK